MDGTWQLLDHLLKYRQWHLNITQGEEIVNMPGLVDQQMTMFISLIIQVCQSLQRWKCYFTKYSILNLLMGLVESPKEFFFMMETYKWNAS